MEDEKKIIKRKQIGGRPPQVTPKVLKYIVRTLLDESNEFSIDAICADAVRKFQLTIGVQSMRTMITKSDLYKANRPKIMELQNRLRHSRLNEFCHSDCWLFWPRWKLIETGYIVKG